jgi:hypothetical protein
MPGSSIAAHRPLQRHPGDSCRDTAWSTGEGRQDVSWAGFVKALAIGAATAVAAAVVSMRIDGFSEQPCTVLGTCAHIKDGMKGE